MREFVTRNVVIRGAHGAAGQDVARALALVREAFALPHEEVERRQWASLVSLLDFVSVHNDFFRSRFRSAGVRPDAPWSLETFRRLPLLTKQDIMDEGARMLSRGRWRLSHRSTSGSTGMPMHISKDAWATAMMDGVMHEVYGWHGIRPGCAQARIWRMPTDPRQALLWTVKDALLNRVRLDASRIDDDHCETFHRRLRRHRPVFLYGYPNAIHACVESWKRLGLAGSRLGIRVVIATGETLYDFQRAAIEPAFGCAVVNEYGSTENGIIAIECAHGRCHVMSPAVYVEILNPDTLEPAAVGEVGELVVSELFSHAWPFIRYRIGDRARRAEGRCPCGVDTPFLAEIGGRSADMILAPDGHPVHDSLLDEVLDCGVRQFKAIQHAPDWIEVSIVPGPEYDPALVAKMERRWKERLGAAMRIEFKVVDRIPADATGKLRVFESRITGRAG